MLKLFKFLILPCVVENQFTERLKNMMLKKSPFKI